MLTLGRLIELALGKEEAGKVDTAIPQAVFDAMTQAARENIAGWYYAPEVKLMGRILTKDECWKQIMHRLDNCQLRAKMLDHDITFTARNWPCFKQHVLNGEIELEEV